MVTNIGDSSKLNYISDHATPASATYCWYFERAQISFRDPSKPTTYEVTPGGETIAALGFTIGDFAAIIDKIETSADYLNLLKAFGYWKKERKLLYLVYKNEWDTNLAQYSDYDTPTTLVGWTGFLTDKLKKPMPLHIDVSCKFKLATQVF